MQGTKWHQFHFNDVVFFFGTFENECNDLKMGMPMQSDRISTSLTKHVKRQYICKIKTSYCQAENYKQNVD